MARTYRRDSRGRFAGGGGGGGGRKGSGGSKGKRIGGGGGSKGAPKTAGTSAPGGTVPKSSVNRSLGSLRGMGGSTKVSGGGGMKSQVARGRQAKAAYKAATSAARQAKMIAGGRTTTRGLGKRTDAGAKSIRANVKAFQSAQAKVRKMERTRKAPTRRRR